MSGPERASGVHLVGTIPLSNTEDVFRTVAGGLGDRLRRVPDGEIGERRYWIFAQVPVLQRNPELEVSRIEFGGESVPVFSLAAPDSADRLDLGNIGYADSAIESYSVFARLKSQGAIAKHLRFQVNLPSPINIVASLVRRDSAAAVEAAYERAIGRELERILATIPHDQLAVQWDTCIEVLMVNGSPHITTWFDVWPGLAERVSRLGRLVPSEVELGFHLCYGDFQHRRLTDLQDTTDVARLANMYTETLHRPITFLHLPVRDDVDLDRYLAPLADLRLAPATELYLGAITDSGGADGAHERIAAARKYVVDREFGVATECGMGRRSDESVPPLLDIHRQVSVPLPQR